MTKAAMSGTIIPVRLQLSRKSGFSLQAASLATNGLPAVNVARPSRWGNIYHIARDDAGWCVYDENDQFMMRASDKLDARRIAVNKFRSWAEDWVLLTPNLMRHHLEIFRGHNVACWCELDGGPCHGDWWLEWSSRPICEAA